MSSTRRRESRSMTSQQKINFRGIYIPFCMIMKGRNLRTLYQHGARHLGFVYSLHIRVKTSINDLSEVSYPTFRLSYLQVVR